MTKYYPILKRLAPLFFFLFSLSVFSQTPDFKVQHIQDDVTRTGGTNTSFTPVSSLNNAIELANNNRKTHAGRSDSNNSDLEGDDLSGARVLTALGTLTYYRESLSVNSNMRFNTSIWEYMGSAGGNNEMIVRGRYTITLNGATNSVTQALSGIVNANKCIPFITGIMNNSNDEDADSGTGIAYLENTTTLRVQKGSNANNVTIYITLVEFTGSNWTVLHGDSGNTDNDTGTMTLYNGSDGTGTATNVSSWNDAIIFGHFRADNNASGNNDAIADLWPMLTPGSDNQKVDWNFHSQHNSNGNNRHFIHVLTNTGINVTRYQNNSSSDNESTVNITSAGLTDINQSLIVGSSTSSGTGTAYGRGWRNYYFNSLTQVAHWSHRNNNIMAHEIQVIDLTGLSSCISYGNNSDGYETGIRSVNFNTINNATPVEDNDYSDFTAISTTVTIGLSYDLTVNVNTDGNWTNHTLAWIDWNQDGDFSDAGNPYNLGTATNVTNGATSNSPLPITIPLTAIEGSTRMRVSTRYNTNPTSCGTGFDGEVEDYTINVVSPITITTGTILPTSYCAGTSVSIPYTIMGTYNAGNIFTAQLSDASGSFASPVTIGTLTGTSDGIISGTIPVGTAAGSGYRIRVVSSNPSIVGTDNGGDLTVNATPIITPNKVDETCTTSDNGSISPVISGGLTNVRYIKLTQKYVNADAWQQVAEIEAFEIFTGTNVALTSNGASATASSIYSNDATIYGPQKAIDGDFTGYSFWHSNSTNIDEYILVDLASAKNIDYLRIHNRVDCCQLRGQNMLLELFDASNNLLYAKTIDLWEGINGPHYINVNVLDVSWADGTTDLNRTGLDSGTYTLNYADEVGCGVSSSINISSINTAPSAPTVDTITQPTCVIATGSVILNGLPATGTWTINPGGITGTGTTTTISGLVAGTYNYTVTNAAGCNSTASANVVINAQPSINTWNGSVSTDWNIAGNWCVGVPTIGLPNTLDVVIPSGLTNYPVIFAGDAPGYVENIDFELGTTLNIIDNSLRVTGNLTINGKIDLEGESQLLQDMGSVLDAASTGTIEIDQQGEGNKYRYNYWSMPVYTGYDAIALKNYTTIAASLKDGTNPSSPGTITFNNSGYDGALTTPITLSSYWMYKFTDSGAGYSAWDQIRSAGKLYTGQGFSMKGPGAPGSSEQNYVFVGKPNNGTIELGVSAGNEYLVGNPYPSAIDADQFLSDNSPSGTASITGAIYFWEHYGGNTHNLAGYQGGYATYSLGGGVQASSFPGLGVGISVKGAPKQYIPVGQAFFVVGDAVDGGQIQFNNGQRVFEKESPSSSIFMKNSNIKVKAETTLRTDLRPKFRIGFDAPKISHRQLLLTIDERATQSVDWGFDAEIYEVFADDMYWMLNNKKYVIQGTNNVSLNSEVPLGMQLSKTGLVTVKIDALENVDDDTAVYLKDKLSGESFNLRDKPVQLNLTAGKYADRFVIVFKTQKLVAEDVVAEVLIPAAAQPIIEGIHVFMDNAIGELQIKNNSTDEIVNVSLTNAVGQRVNYWNTNLNQRTISLPVSSATGVYLVQINTKNGATNKKIVVD